MDKMGESAAAGNRGRPATPRHGAPVELVGLLASTLRWLSSRYPGQGVQVAGQLLTYEAWAAKLRRNFEAAFWLPTEAGDDPAYHVEARLVQQRGHYRDVVGPSDPFASYQLRPNQAIALAVAPELFDPAHARTALQTLGRLLGPLGMRTLDPADPQYRPNYTTQDSQDWATAGGFNYHQGPEWLWPLGYYLRAQQHFEGQPQLALLQPHLAHLASSDWCGLPELTNQNGSPCHASCPTQAWSLATLLHALSLCPQPQH